MNNRARRFKRAMQAITGNEPVQWSSEMWHMFQDQLFGIGLNKGPMGVRFAVTLTSFGQAYMGVTGQVSSPAITPPTGVSGVLGLNAWTFPRGNQTYTFGTGLSANGSPQINQIIQVTRTIAASGNYAGAINAQNSNICGVAASTVTALKAASVELLNAAQGGTTASTIVLGNNGSNPWAGPFGTTGTYTLNSGEMWYHETPTAGGYAVGSSDVLKMVNSDSVNNASVRTCYLGLA